MIFTPKERFTNLKRPMCDEKLLARYNYDEFIPEKFEPWFELRPPIRQPGA